MEEAGQRRALHNQLMDLKGAIRVFCRVRPLLPREQAAQQATALACDLLTNSVTVTGSRSVMHLLLDHSSHPAVQALA